MNIAGACPVTSSSSRCHLPSSGSIDSRMHQTVCRYVHRRIQGDHAKICRSNLFCILSLCSNSLTCLTVWAGMLLLSVMVKYLRGDLYALQLQLSSMTWQHISATCCWLTGHLRPLCKAVCDPATPHIPPPLPPTRGFML